MGDLKQKAGNARASFGGRSGYLACYLRSSLRRRDVSRAGQSVHRLQEKVPPNRHRTPQSSCIASTSQLMQLLAARSAIGLLAWLRTRGNKRWRFFLIERNFAEEVNATPEIAAAIKQVNMDVGVNWLFSFLSADKRKTYCLYEAPNAEAIREAAQRLKLPADVIVELGDMRISTGPELFTPARGG